MAVKLMELFKLHLQHYNTILALVKWLKFFYKGIDNNGYR